MGDSRCLLSASLEKVVHIKLGTARTEYSYNKLCVYVGECVGGGGRYIPSAY